MADLTPLNYDPSQIEDMGDGFKVIPPGTYNVMVVDSYLQTTRSGGEMLVLKYQIVDGAYIGDTVVDRLNLVNASETAQKIGLSQLKNICDAIKHRGKLRNSEQLHGRVFSVKVVVEKFESNKEPGKMLDSNKIEKRMKKQAASTSAAVPASGAADQPKAAVSW